MNAADRSQLAELFTLIGRLADVPLPGADESLPAAEYLAAHDKAQNEYRELTDRRAQQISGHMGYLAAAAADGQELGKRITVITTIVTRDLARPLPYQPYKPAGVPA